MEVSGNMNPFVRQFMIRHWRKQKKLAGQSKSTLPADMPPGPPEPEKILEDREEGQDGNLLFNSNEQGDDSQ